ncbi:xaa-Pro dipeptidyl-peptidase [Lactobacillus selangorensis]|uniref:Xaa-Pro dipeptidyl-peptidase n=1 Tax=Lactobacillus selangorensis TaxID=81857 RepID=A0A0R2FWM6_9LACO|nr:Xaa-Pro dipeptidyl-peptidase [Lactobacillus selangorensis]KRN29690.1 xaa-Pro dipeptidyl-peptidase [Lactobacillus selangorensis]KRN33781.1 xaa-Pro dipeptidyl-peptidase [Lactobacillus selangorensis]
MHLNQFARLQPDFQEQLTELQAIHLLDQDEVNAPLPELARTVFSRLFPAAHSASARREAEMKLSVSDGRSLAAYLDQLVASFDAVAFENSALQMLGFEAQTEFSLREPRVFMDKIGLPHLNETTFDHDTFLKAVYFLLNTRAKNGQVFLDLLTAQGFFNGFWQPANQQPHFVIFNGKSQPVFDPHQFIREVVYVEAPLDTDEDGQRDLLETTIFRPVETNHGLKVPALYTANPYFKGTNDMTEQLHDVNRDLNRKEPNDTTYHDIEFNGQRPDLPAARTPEGESDQSDVYGGTNGIYSLNDYFLARGFANVYAGGIGTRGSDGIRTCGGPEETTSTIAIIEWLAGNRVAYTNRTDHIAIKAWWCTGLVAMTGKSYLGTLAIAAATTGVEGLKTVISEAAISSWYDYYRDNGLVVAPVDCQGEDCDVLAEDCFSRQKDAADWKQVQPVFDAEMQKLRTGQDRTTGNYNTFWDARNYRKHVAGIKCDIISVHGLNDWNVKPRNVGKFWNALRTTKVPHKIFLHQGKHIYMNNFQSIDFTDMMNLWLANELLGVENGAMDRIPTATIEDNVDPTEWHHYRDWNDPKAPKTLFYVTKDHGLTRDEPDDEKMLTFTDDGTERFLAGDHDEHKWQHQLIQAESPYSDNRLLFQTKPYDHDVYIDGEIAVTLQAAVNQDKGLLSVMVLDYGTANRPLADPTVLAAKGQYLGYDWKTDDVKDFRLETQPSDAHVITRGHINLQNRRHPWENEELKPNEFVTVHFDLQPTHYHLPAGRRLGLCVYATDMGMTVRSKQKAVYSLDLNACQLEVPFER